MLGVLTTASFMLSTSGIGLSPFFASISTDLNVQLVAITNLLSFTAVSWGICSLLSGMLSDRIGRRPILVIAVLCMGLAQTSFSQAPSYTIAIICTIIAGLCGGGYTGTVYAAVSDYVPNSQRGRALGWIITGQSLSLVLGVPMITLLGAVGGWRGALLTYGIMTMLLAFAVWLVTPADPVRERSLEPRPRTPMSVIARPAILLLLGAGIAERICFAIIAVYMALYLQTSYGVSLTQLAFGLGLVAMGNVIGNITGGQLADRVRSRTLLYAASALITSCLALPLMLWQPGLSISLALGFAYSFCNALGRPSLIATLSEVPADVRGAVLGMNVTSASVGWLTSAALGGWLVTHIGFTPLGILCAIAGIIGATLGIMHWRITATLR